MPPAVAGSTPYSIKVEQFSTSKIALTTHLLLVAFYYGRMHYFIPYNNSLLLYYLLLSGLIAAATTFATLRRSSLFTLFFFLGTLVYSAIFALQFDLPFTGDLSASFPGIYTAAILGIFLRRHSLDEALSAIYNSCLIYAGLFLFFTFTLDQSSLAAAHVIGAEKSGGVLIKHNMEGMAQSQLGFRLRISPLHLSFGALYSAWRLRSKVTLLGIAQLGLFVLSLAIADFRFLAITTGLSLLASFALKPSTLARVFFGFNSLIMALVLACALFNLNPFELISFDNSGLIRQRQAELALEMFRARPWAGTGLPNGTNDLATVFGTRSFSPSDIGYLGSLLQYGILGYILLFFSTYSLYRFILRIDREEHAAGMSRAAAAVFAFIMLYQLISSFLWEEAGSLLLALSVAYGWSSLRVRAAQPK